MEFYANFLQVGSVATIGVNVEDVKQGARITAIETFIKEETTFEDADGTQIAGSTTFLPLIRLLDETYTANAAWSTRRICRLPCDNTMRPSTRSSNRDTLARVDHKVVMQVHYKIGDKGTVQQTAIEKPIQIASVSLKRLFKSSARVCI